MSLGKRVMKSWNKHSDKIRAGIHDNATTILGTTAGITAGAALNGPAGALALGGVGAAAGNYIDIARAKLRKTKKPDKTTITEGRARDILKAYQLHTRLERNKTGGNLGMHPLVQAGAAVVAADHIGHAIHNTIVGDYGNASMRAMGALGVVSPYLVNHPREIKRIYKHLRDQPKRDAAWAEHKAQKEAQAKSDAERIAKKVIRDKVNAKRRETYAKKKASS